MLGCILTRTRMKGFIGLNHSGEFKFERDVFLFCEHELYGYTRILLILKVGYGLKAVFQGR